MIILYREDLPQDLPLSRKSQISKRSRRNLTTNLTNHHEPNGDIKAKVRGVRDHLPPRNLYRKEAKERGQSKDLRAKPSSPFSTSLTLRLKIPQINFRAGA
ncbi:MAG: hypothetical protein LBK05_02180 [Treponema sp.]|jgi:hypothetical protein|nr:hypothetical protein [Treponema sp.]